jgi:hypothetical protein
LVTRHLLLILLLLRLPVIATIMPARVGRRGLAGFSRCHLVLLLAEENLRDSPVSRRNGCSRPVRAGHTSASAM